MPGEAFCETCGAALNTPAPSLATPTPAFGSPAYPSSAHAPGGSPALAPAVAPTTLQRARLLIQPAGVEIAFPDAAQAIVGRADASSNFFPDVDLDQYDALSNGVSRSHARVLLQDGRVLIEDLDTTNGTAVNRQRLAPRQTQPIRDGDEIRFGKLVATFHYSA
jgi:pSer/pThr/pTyr-binding forkhead associated (FHA) protein